jgi:hypothetical protein
MSGTLRTMGAISGSNAIVYTQGQEVHNKYFAKKESILSKNNAPRDVSARRS